MTSTVVTLTKTTAVAAPADRAAAAEAVLTRGRCGRYRIVIRARTHRITTVCGPGYSLGCVSGWHRYGHARALRAVRRGRAVEDERVDARTAQ
jgi:hypothetical protein